MLVARLLLARIDPAQWRFSVHSNPAGYRDSATLLGELQTVLAVNGRYIGLLKGNPDTTLISNGVSMGPAEYEASHGAFVASARDANVVDLKGKDWRRVFAGKTNAMVSYPLLVDENGLSRAKQSEWLAGRSFVGQDRYGKIIIGTTADAFLSLEDSPNC